MPTLLSDLCQGIRTLRHNPGFTAVAVLSLALGIGANTAIFQLIDTVRLRTLPVADPQRLAVVQFVDTSTQRGGHATAYPAVTNPQWEHFRDSQDIFSGLLAWWPSDFGLSTGGERRGARGIYVSGDYFHVLGVNPVRGRVFSAADDHRGCGLAGAVISYGFWQREFGGDPAVVGRKITLNYQPVEVIGVTPAAFTGLEVGRAYDVAVPICSQPALMTQNSWLDQGTIWWLTVVGRLKPGATLAQANARLKAISPGLFRATLPANYPPVSVKDYLVMQLAAGPMAAGFSMLREQYSDPLSLLLVTAALVLLIACANLANLMLARGAARGHEIAVRMAIGASRARMIRTLMAEGILLAAAGATLGLFLSTQLSRLLVGLLSQGGDPLSLDLAPDGVVLAFTIGVATATCLLFGLIPAWRASNVAPQDAMRGKGRVTGDSSRFGLRQVLVSSQVALSLVLVSGALLFSGSLRNLLAVDAGFQQNGLLIAQFDFSRAPIAANQRVAFKHSIIDKIRALPGVDAAGEVDALPLSGSGTTNRVWREDTDGAAKITADFDWIGGGYLKAMGTPLLEGRDFNDHDAMGTPRVAIVSQTFARRMNLGEHPVGKRFHRESTPVTPELSVEIVGLVRDTKHYKLSEDFLPLVFFDVDQDAPDPGATVAIRSSAPLAGVIAQTKAALLSTNREITMQLRPFSDTVEDGLIRERLLATLSNFFGALAALIAALGLYGVMSYLVARRTNEIGVRVALGASRKDIVALILRQSGMLLALGLAGGTVLALVLGRSVSSLLFGMRPNDAGVLGIAVVGLGAITLAASYLPARRASKLEPMSALREE